MISKLVSLFLVILIFLFSDLSAEFHIGAIGGVNFADLDAYVDGRSKKAESLPKGCGGIVLDLDLTEYFVLRCTPMYVPKGGNILDALRDIEDVEMEIECSYIEFPLFIKTNHDNRLNLYLYGGPTLSYLLDCKTDLKVDASVFNPQATGIVTFNGDLMDTTNRLDIGVGIGWGFKVPLNNFVIFAEMQYIRGLTNSRKTGELFIEGEYEGEEISDSVILDKEDNRYANQGLQLLLGFTY